VASTYERFRPGPPPAAIAWMLPDSANIVVDLGAGTGAMTKDLLGKVDRVIAIEPDDRMREILASNLPEVTALRGTGESMPLDTSSVDVVLASSSWHWMDPDRALQETARVLVPGGTLGVVWAGPDPDGPFVSQPQVPIVSRIWVGMLWTPRTGSRQWFGSPMTPSSLNQSRRP
jgi:ubiquinone/menaquinone biosynthesis C-methylase UbiE